MSYDPSHRRPPRQERWPSATPAEGWPSYRDGDAYLGGEQADDRWEAGRQDAYQTGRHHAGYQRAIGGTANRGYQSSVITEDFPPGGNGYGATADGGYQTGGYQTGGYQTGGYRTGSYPGGDHTGDASGYAADDFAGPANGYGGANHGYGSTADGYAWATNGHTSDSSGYAGTGNGYDDTRDGYAGTVGGYQGAADGFDGMTDGFDGASDGYGWADSRYGQADGGYGQADGGYGRPGDGYGYGQAGGEYASDGYDRDRGVGYETTAGGYLGPGSYTEYNEPRPGDPSLVAPDAGVRPDTWRAEQDSRREARRRGMAVGAVTEILGIAVAIGVSTLAAGLLKAQTSPIAAMGSVFIDRTPAALRNALAGHFGTHGRTVLLLGMYAAIAFAALVTGVLARRAATVGVAGLAAFTLLAAFVVITRPASHVGDMTPAVAGGIAGVAALLWLVRASAPIAPLRPVRGGARRRTR